MLNDLALGTGFPADELVEMSALISKRTTESLRVGLEAVKMPYETASGAADFQALRAAYGSSFVASGASVKTSQYLARHSTPSLNIGFYAKALLHDIKGTVENLPELASKKPAPEPSAMTRTDPVATPINEHLGHQLAEVAAELGPTQKSVRKAKSRVFHRIKDEVGALIV